MLQFASLCDDIQTPHEMTTDLRKLPQQVCILLYCRDSAIPKSICHSDRQCWKSHHNDSLWLCYMAIACLAASHLVIVPSVHLSTVCGHSLFLQHDLHPFISNYNIFLRLLRKAVLKFLPPVQSTSLSCLVNLATSNIIVCLSFLSEFYVIHMCNLTCSRKEYDTSLILSNYSSSPLSAANKYVE